MNTYEIQADVVECLELAAKKEAATSGWKVRLPTNEADLRQEAVEEVIAGWSEERVEDIVTARGWEWQGTTARGAALFRWRTARARVAIRELTQGAALVEFHEELDAHGCTKEFSFEVLFQRAKSRVCRALTGDIPSGGGETREGEKVNENKALENLISKAVRDGFLPFQRELEITKCAAVASNANAARARVAAEQSAGILSRLWEWLKGLRGWPGRKTKTGKRGGRPPYPSPMLEEAHNRMDGAGWGEKKVIAGEVLDEWHKAGKWSVDSNKPNAISNFMRAVQDHYPPEKRD